VIARLASGDNAGKSSLPQNGEIDCPTRFVIFLCGQQKEGGELQDTVERKSRLVSLAYEVLETIDLPPPNASESEVLAALASAFHRKALVAVEAELDTPRGKPAFPDIGHVSVFEKRMGWSPLRADPAL
jgi:hypothetical protein